MEVVKRIKAKARASVKRIVLPEGDEPRTVEAARIVAEEGVAEPILLTSEIIARAENKSRFDAYAAKLYELRKAKGLTEEAAAKLVADPMYYGMMMVKQGDADGLVSGAVHSTGDMLRPALQIIKTAPGMKLVWDTMIYQICKQIGEMAVVLCGKVDGIILTGGLVRFADIVEGIEKHCGFIAPVSAYPGEMEQEALGLSALKVLRGEVVPLTYSGRDVWQGFEGMDL